MTEAWLDQMVDDSPAARHIAWTGELVFAGAREDDKVGRTVKFDIRVQPEDVGKANPFATFTRRRAGHAGTIFEASFAGIFNNTFELAAEVMLLNWSDGPSGSSVTFVLPPVGTTNPFMWCTRGQSNFMAVLLEKADDETFVDQKKRERVEGRGQKPSNAAAQIIKNPRYWEYMNEVAFCDISTAAAADGAMKKALWIDSKAELDSSPERARMFRQHMDEFVAWQKEKGYL